MTIKANAGTKTVLIKNAQGTTATILEALEETLKKLKVTEVIIK